MWPEIRRDIPLIASGDIIRAYNPCAYWAKIFVLDFIKGSKASCMFTRSNEYNLFC